MALTVCDQRGRIDAATGAPHNERLDAFSPFLVGHSDNGGFGHIRVGDQRSFDLARIDVLATGDDHVFLSVDNENKSLVIHVAQIARLKPAVAHDLQRQQRVVPVSLHQGRARQHDLADLTGPALPSVGTDDPDVAVVVWLPRRSKAGGNLRRTVQRVLAGLQRRSADAFRKPVDLGEDPAKPSDCPTQQCLGHRRRRVENIGQTGRVISRSVGLFEKLVD